ncbi:uncharacterized protein LOC124108052 [Marmota monax]|uniref:uncharacterized protein LOC124108052 n=1 Tax=Marmota monax TaxID=9995 RepID=UPI001EAFEE91|nr:uncharacterized protein LOC124108052 [Marmota monax]
MARPGSKSGPWAWSPPRAQAPPPRPPAARPSPCAPFPLPPSTAATSARPPEVGPRQPLPSHVPPILSHPTPAHHHRHYGSAGRGSAVLEVVLQSLFTGLKSRFGQSQIWELLCSANIELKKCDKPRYP